MQINTHSLAHFKGWMVRHQALLFLMLVAVLGRVLPHPDNFTPLAAIGLFAGAYLSRQIFLIVPIIAAFVGDVTELGMYNLVIMGFVYAGLVLSSLSGRMVLHNKPKLTRLPIAILASALGFYLVSNLGPWWVFYEHSGSGLLNSYLNGLPYLGRSLAGDVFYSIIFFGLFEAMKAGQRRYPVSA